MKAKNYNNFLEEALDTTQGVQAGLQNTIQCVANPALCAAQAITELFVSGMDYANQVENRKLIKKTLEANDYQIKETIKFEQWQALVKQQIITNAFAGKLKTTRISQKSDLMLTGILRNYYLNKVNQIKKQNEMQVKRWKSAIITLIAGSILIYSAYLFTKNIN
jgi:hypothetical protein